MDDPEVTGLGNRTQTQKDRSWCVVVMPDGSIEGAMPRAHAEEYAAEKGGVVKTLWRPHGETISGRDPF